MYLSCKRAIWGGGGGVGDLEVTRLLLTIFIFLRTTFFNHFKVMRLLVFFCVIFSQNQL